VAKRAARRWNVDGITYFRHEQSSLVWCELWIKGRRFRRSTDERDQEAAETAGRRIRVELEAQLDGAPPLADKLLFLETWAARDVQQCRDSAKNERSPASVESSWVQIMKHLGCELRLTDIDIGTLREYRTLRRTKDEARDQTIVREWHALRRAFRGALELKRVQEHRDTADHLRNMLATWPKMGSRDRADQGRRGHLRTPEEIQAVCARADAEVRDKLLFALMTGLRAEELSRIKFAWFEEAPPGHDVPAILRFPSEAAKTLDGGGTLGVPELALEIVKRRFQGDTNATVFTNEVHKTQLRNISKELGIEPRLKFRDMRTTHITWAKEGTGRIDVSQAAARHSDPRTTMRYIRQYELNPDALAAAAAVANRFKPSQPTVPGATLKKAKLLTGSIQSEFGAGDEIRTRDPQLGKLMLYQLSYTRTEGCR
jgi:integrase